MVMAGKTAGLLAPALKAITQYLVGAEVVHLDETGLRTAGRLAWAHSASWEKFALVTVHARRGKDGMKAAGVLPHFRVCTGATLARVRRMGQRG
jgi:hypothetical protein